jgi:hypothetical protein
LKKFLDASVLILGMAVPCHPRICFGFTPEYPSVVGIAQSRCGLNQRVEHGL